MISMFECNPQPLLESLEGLTGTLQPLARNRWALPADPGSEQTVTARLSEGWLTLEAAWNGAASPSQSEADYLRSLLELNFRLGPSCKIGMEPAGSLVLTAEMPLDDEPAANGAARIESLVCDFKDALKLGQGETFASNEFDVDTTSAIVTDSETATDLLTQAAQTCDETGWSYERRDASLALTLETHEDYYQAELVARPDASISLGVSLSVEPSDSPACELATAILLLRTCCEVRAVRATWNPGEEYFPYRFEATWEELPTPSDLGHSLAGLSLAARLCGAETQSLQQETIAIRFLTFQGRSLKELTATASTN